jgi:hypothetical protein
MTDEQRAALVKAGIDLAFRTIEDQLAKAKERAAEDVMGVVRESAERLRQRYDDPIGEDDAGAV